jgi:ATP-dependent helicase/nuclease subunit A
MGRIGDDDTGAYDMTDSATAAQIEAADPRASTWLSANAGSGKTRVLTNRVARLLLQGTEPRNILCLTYTKAAASEMQNRLFLTLGDWAMKSDEDLRKELLLLGEEPPKDLAKARTLFARAIEVPGGLRIQTIHALCASILRQFPLEGGVSPQFREMDDASRDALIVDVLDSLADTAPQVLSDVSAFYSDDSLVGLGRLVSSKADDFVITRSKADIFSAFDVPVEQTIDAILNEVFTPGDMRLLHSVGAALFQSESTNDLKDAQRLSDLPNAPTMTALLKLEKIVLTGEGAKPPFSAKIGKIPTKKGQVLPEITPLLPTFDALIQRVHDARPARVALRSAERNTALHKFAQTFLPAYAAAKRDRGVLDFDDLIRRTRDMLKGSALNWVLYRLDGQIEHILVDEAQDTSPAQWQIVNALTEQMIDDDNRERTLFVVGDKKQSIYSFQGADAEGFDKKQQEFDAQLAGSLKGRELKHSFRSSSAILSLVDQICDGLDGVGSAVQHHAYFDQKPGRVDLLPLNMPPDQIDEPEWHDPRDRPVDNDASFALGKQVAKIITRLLETETIQRKDGNFTPVQPGDIMILVQKRSTVFDRIIHACKTANLPIAGSDRLKVAGELAVRDLLACLSFLTLPEDDLSLAAALRSPLFGWSEAQLYDLAAKRPKGSSIWTELCKRRDEFSETFAILDRLRDRADFLRPYELLEEILNEYGGREKLLARLGTEAEDGIDELLNQAISFEREEVPSVTGFLTRVGSENVEVKRDADAADHLIQIMTIHGAKGLERPIVILPDTAGEARDMPGGLLTDDDGLVVLWTSKAESPANIHEAKERKKSAERAERNRLLYVAMTRAESWLIVGGAGLKNRSTDALNWHRTIRDGMEKCGAEPSPFDPGGLRLEHGNWQEPHDPMPLERSVEIAVLPEFLVQPAMSGKDVPTPISPSKLPGAKVLAGGALAEEDAKRRGRQIHLLLEHLPGQADPEVAARRLLETGPDKASAEEIPELFNQAMRNLTMHPEIFAGSALAEVDISANLPSLDGMAILGAIDRLIVSPDMVQAIDFKTNANVPNSPDETPEGLLRQMGAYLEGLEAIYPDRKIEVAILWTETCELMVLPHAIVRTALEGTTIS